MRVVRNIDWTNNSKIANFWIQILVSEWKKFWKFAYFLIRTIPELGILKTRKFTILKILMIFNLANFKNWQLGKFQKFAILEICNLKNSKIPNLENPKNFQFGKFQEILTWKIPKFCNYNSKNI